MTPRTQHRVSACALIAAVAALPVTASPTSAQYLDPDRCVTCQDKREHFAAGVGLDLLARGPWVSRSFRDAAWKRVALTAVVATTWEVFQGFEARRDGRVGRPGYGFGSLDIVASIAGAVTSEVVTRVVLDAIRHR